MPANVTERDGVFTVRQPAWWDLQEAHVLADYPSRTEAQKIAHPWEPAEEPLYRVRFGPRGEESYEPVPDFKLMVRDDSFDGIGVVGADYTPTLNSELWDIAEVIEGLEPGSVRYETGGSLLGGRKVWLLLRLAEPLVVGPQGEVIPYYALQNSHDGTGSFRGQATLTRIVCDNTSQAADYDSQARGTEFVFRHTSGIHDRIEEAKQALAGWRQGITAWQQVAEDLLDIYIDPAQQTEFLERFIPMPPPHAVSPRVVDNVARARNQITEILHSATCDGIADTAYGLVQAATEYHQHVRLAKSAETRFKRAYLDRSTVVADARRIAVEVAG